MNSTRYFLAAFLVVSLPGLFSYWLLIHPFVGFWRGKGLSVTLTVVLTVVFAIMIGLLSFRHYLLSQNYGTNYLLIAVGIVCLVLSGTMRFAIHKRLNVTTLLGLPEIAPNRFPRQLITDGIYGRVRHPRYVQLVVALLG
jgi:protein-S-isoprenylcysteine O-methyltransferase Ste14